MSSKQAYSRKYPKKLFTDEYLNHLAELEERLHKKIDETDDTTKKMGTLASRIYTVGLAIAVVGVIGLLSSQFLGLSNRYENLVAMCFSFISISGQVLFMYATRIQYKIAKQVAETMNEYKEIRLKQDEVVSKINYQQSDGAC